MRTDKFISLLLYKSMFWVNRKKTPILMYHSVCPSISNPRHQYFSTETTPETFEKQIRLLLKNKYSVVSLLDVINESTIRVSDQKRVAITFDDGYQDFYAYAFPILMKYKLPATVFIPAGLIENGDTELNGKKLMNWEQIKTCYKQGIQIGSHSLTHPKLITLPFCQLKNELLQSKTVLEEMLSTNIECFSYPYKFPEENKTFVETFCNQLAEFGYRLNVTTRIGCHKPEDNIFLIKRIPINEYDDESLFVAKMHGAYDWLYGIQLLSKYTRAQVLKLRGQK